MDLLKAVVYGIVQGLTEFLPVSSSAHLRLTPVLFGWPDPGAAFTAVIQLGTTLAVLIYFAGDLGRAISAWFKSFTGGDKDNDDARMGWAVFYGTIPIVVLGFALSHKIETAFRSLYVVAFGLIVMGIVMFVADRLVGTRKTGSVTVKDGIVVGLWQCLALLPGMSRSGSTISGGRILGFDRSSAARFSFLLGVPSITLAGLYEAVKERKNLDGAMLMPTLVATAVSFVVGYASIWWLMRFIEKRGIAPFVVYRVVLGIVLLGLLLSNRLSPEAGLPSSPKSPAKPMFRKKLPAPTLPPEWLIVGLGNPGPEYKGTRHNIGFELIDRLAERHRIKLDRAKHQARYGVGTLFETSVVLAKPLTFMNLSGRSVGPLMREYSLKPERILVVADDTDLAPGRVRLRSEGSAGGHNGHKSLIQTLGTQEYPRLKIGIGRTSKDATIDHVLGPFHPDERPDIETALRKCEEAIEVLFLRGIEAAMGVANGP